jgi:hypothetical protein
MNTNFLRIFLRLRVSQREALSGASQHQIVSLGIVAWQSSRTSMPGGSAQSPDLGMFVQAEMLLASGQGLCTCSMKS